MAGTGHHQLFLRLATTFACLLTHSISFPISAVPYLRLVPPSGVYVANEGSKFNLQCIADVYPVTSLMWVRNLGIESQGMADVCIMWTTCIVTAISIIFAETVTSSSTSSVNLTYPRVSSRDSGTYSCVARTSFNNMANITAVIFVTSELKLMCTHDQLTLYIIGLQDVVLFFLKGTALKNLQVNWPGLPHNLDKVWCSHVFQTQLLQISLLPEHVTVMETGWNQTLVTA